MLLATTDAAGLTGLLGSFVDGPGDSHCAININERLHKAAFRLRTMLNEEVQLIVRAAPEAATVRIHPIEFEIPGISPARENYVATNYSSSHNMSCGGSIEKQSWSA